MRNLFYTPQNFIAKTETGDLVSVNDVIENDINTDLFCPCCNSKLLLRAKDSEHMQPHFKHENGESCLEYNKSDKTQREDVFYAREMELTEQQVENYKERIEGLEYILNIYQQIKTQAKLTGDISKLKPIFLTAISVLDIEDQLFVYDYAKTKICLKELKDDMAKTINGNLLKNLNDKYKEYDVTFTKVKPHFVEAVYDECTIWVNNYQYGYPKILLNEDDLQRINKEIPKKVNEIKTGKYILKAAKEYLKENYPNEDVTTKLNYTYGYDCVKIEFYNNYKWINAEDKDKIKEVIDNIIIEGRKDKKCNDLRNAIIDIIKELNNEDAKKELFMKLNYTGYNDFVLEVYLEFNDKIKDSIIYDLSIKKIIITINPNNFDIYYEAFEPKTHIWNEQIVSLNEIKDKLITTLNKTKEIIDIRKQEIMKENPCIPKSKVRIDRDGNYTIYSKDSEKEYISVFRKNDMFTDGENYYPIRNPAILDKLFSRELGNKGSFIRDWHSAYIFKLEEFYPPKQIEEPEYTIDEKYEDEEYYELG